MKLCWLQGFIVTLITSYSTSVLIRLPPVSNNRCNFEETKDSVGNFVYDHISELFLREHGTWTQVANVDMSDNTQICPSAWSAVNSTVNSTVRACGRQELRFGPSCDSVFFSTNGKEYSRVSGRITGYQYGFTPGFLSSFQTNPPGIDSWYINGVSLTHGAPGSRTHVWSFVNAFTETTSANGVCACMFSNYSEWPFNVPNFVGNNYFCATGHNQYFSSHNSILFHNPLWDGEGCTGSNTCCQFNQPPWFYRTLPAATTDDLEVRICGCCRTSFTNIFISRIELYVKWASGNIRL